MTTVTYNSGYGTFVVPAGVTSVLCKLWGGGGGGGQGGDGGGNQGGTGGGGGSYCQVALSVSEDDEIAYVVGGSGLGLVDEEYGCGLGSAGGATTIIFGEDTYLAGGGNGGSSCGSTDIGTGGVSTDGDYHENGGDGSAYDSGNFGGAGGGAGATAELVAETRKDSRTGFQVNRRAVVVAAAENCTAAGMVHKVACNSCILKQADPLLLVLCFSHSKSMDTEK